MSTSSATTTYTYAETGYANPHAATSVGGATLTYDNNGNMTAIGSLDYSWDWKNRLASAERTVGGNTTYGYDHTGQRTFKATGTATTSYPSKYLNLATTTGAVTTTKHIFSPGGELLATIVGASTTASTTYLHGDHLGGTNVTTDEDGEVTQTLDYYPYGSQRIATGSFAEQRRFVGEEFDGDTEFSYLNARYYSGDRGKFLSQDPLARDNPEQLVADPQKFNSYSYARNNPIAYLDTNGLSEAYFGSRSIFGVGPWVHTYQAYSIDSQSEANQLRIGVPVPSNVSADNPFNFTLGFGPVGESLKGGIGYAGGLGDNAWSRDYSSANSNGFTSSGYDLSPGAQGNYAQLANTSYNVAQGINAGGVPYGFLGSVNVWNAIALRNYYNSNSAISTVSSLTGQGGTYKQFLSAVNAPGGGNNTMSVTSVGAGSVAQSTPSYLVGNQMGAFAGTYNFGSGIGTYDFGSKAWMK